MAYNCVKPYTITSDNPKMAKSVEAVDKVRKPYITGGIVSPAMDYKENDDDDYKKKKKRKK